MHILVTGIQKQTLRNHCQKSLFTLSMSHSKMKQLNETAKILLDMFIVLDKQKAIMHYWSLFEG